MRIRLAALVGVVFVMAAAGAPEVAMPQTARSLFERHVAAELAAVDAPPPEWPTVSDEFVKTTPYLELHTWMQETRREVRRPRDVIYRKIQMQGWTRPPAPPHQESIDFEISPVFDPAPFRYAGVGVLPDRQWHLLFDRLDRDLVGDDRDTRRSARYMVGRLAFVELSGLGMTVGGETKLAPCPFPGRRDRIARIMRDFAFEGPIDEASGYLHLVQQLSSYDAIFTPEVVALLIEALPLEWTSGHDLPAGALLESIAYSNGLEGLDGRLLHFIEQQLDAGERRRNHIRYFNSLATMVVEQPRRAVEIMRRCANAAPEGREVLMVMRSPQIIERREVDRSDAFLEVATQAVVDWWLEDIDHPDPMMRTGVAYAFAYGSNNTIDLTKVHAEAIAAQWMVETEPEAKRMFESALQMAGYPLPVMVP